VKHSFSFLIIFFFALNLQAQVFPVQGNTQITPPYSPYLADYTAPGSQRLSLQLRLTDPTEIEYRVRLRVIIEGVGITLRTKPNYIPQPLTIQGGGMLQQFYGEDLAEYFNPANLDFGGYSRKEFDKTGRLPEGVYRFTIEAFDYNRNVLVSNKATAVAWMILNDPPLLNLPRKDMKMQILDPTNIPFTWTPRHTASPNAAFTTEYIFRLVEIWPLNRNPYDAFLSQSPLYEVTTQQSQIIYGLAEPALIPGRKYAWQVQAIDTENRDLFKNQGRSEVYVFQYGDALGAPQNLKLQSANPSTLNLRWDQPSAGSGGIINFRLKYRPHLNRKQDTWYEVPADDLWKTLIQLQPDTEYEVQVRAEQYPQLSEYTAVSIFKTLPAGANQFVCKSDVPPPPLPNNNTPAFELAINDTIHAGGYEVLVSEVSTGNHKYTGSGLAIIPWFNSAKVRVTFENISVNQQHWLTAGEIKTVWDASSKFLLESEGETSPGSVKTQVGELPITIVATDSLINIVGAAIVSVTKDEDGNIVVQTSDGQTKTLEKDKSYSIVDEVGNGYVVDKQGNIAKTTATEALAARDRGDRTYEIKLKFENGDGKFGFDKKKYDALAQNYQEIDNENYAAWKAVSSAESDVVYATIEDKTLDPKEIQFEINGTPAASTYKKGKFIIDLTGKAEGTTEELLAYENDKKEKVIGKLNIVSYGKINRSLVIVSVNNNRYPHKLSNLKEQLNKIYEQTVTEWSITEEDNLEVNLDPQFDDGESGLLTNYTSDMKKVINAYTKDHKLADDTYYLFMVTKPKSNTKLGYMPRKKQAGFIFIDKLSNETNVIKTIAHELSHGAFRLEHSFIEYPSLAENSTDNLMDYGNGTTLCKYQWDNIHNPVPMLSLFDGDEEGAMKSLLTSKYVFMHDQLSTKAYASKKGIDEFTQEGINYVDANLYQLDTAGMKTYIYFAYIWFHQGNISRFDQLMESSFEHAYDSIKKSQGTKDFNLLAIVNAKYDTALANGVKTVSFREKFFPVSGLSAECTKSVNDYVNSASKKTFVNGLDDALKQRANILLAKLKDCKVIIPEEIVIHYKRKGRNQYRTWGEFTIVGTDYKGYILERPRGDNAPKLDDFRRYPPGIYDIGYSENAGGKITDFYYVTLYIIKNSAYKLHGGNRADQSDGCLLINSYSPENDKYTDAYQYEAQDVKAKKSKPVSERGSVANRYYGHQDPNNPAYKLRKKVEELEAKIKEKYKIDKAVKKIIIDESEENVEQ
jgi:hypothetical protein